MGCEADSGKPSMALSADSVCHSLNLEPFEMGFMLENITTSVLYKVDLIRLKVHGANKVSSR